MSRSDMGNPLPGGALRDEATNEQHQCEATTKSGARCRAKALPGRPWCFTHDPQMADRRRRARASGGRAAAQVRRLNAKRADLSDPAVLLKFASELVQDTLAGRVEVGVARCVLYGIGILRQVVETAELERRVARLEQRLAEREVTT